AAIGSLELAVRASFAEAHLLLQEDESLLLLVHLVHQSDAEPIADLLRQIAAARRPLAMVIIGDKDHAEQALTLLRLGAVDYLTRPVDLSRLSFLVDTLTVRARYTSLAAGADELERLGTGEPFFFLKSGDMSRLMEQVRRVAPQDTTLLLGGETGTGKTRLARLVHELSPRAGEPFQVIHCGALAPSLIESEMFGHLKGSFTGADRDRAGKF